jgi:hypothetical protein
VRASRPLDRWRDLPRPAFELRLVPFDCLTPLAARPGVSDMQRLLCIIALCALSLSTGRLVADEAYSIHRKEPTRGDVYQVQKTDAVTINTKVQDSGGKTLLDSKSSTVMSCSFRETVLKCEGKCPTRLERVYEQAQVTVDGKTTDLAYKGKTVLIEKNDGRYTFTMDGKELTGVEAEHLIKEFVVGVDSKADLERAVVPKSPVKINESWKMDLAPFIADTARSGQMELDPEKAKGTATLMNAYQKDGKLFAEIKVGLMLPIKSLGKGILKVATQDGSAAAVEMDLDGCADGSCKTANIKRVTKMEAKSSMSLPDGTKVPMMLSVQYKVEENRQDVTKEVNKN